MRKLALSTIAFALLAAPPVLAQRIDQLPKTEGGNLLAAPRFMPAPPAPTGLSEGIAAIVNDSIVSTGDVRARLALALLSSGLPDSAEVRAKLLPQVLRSLVDEQLQLQEGKKLDISIPAEDVRNALVKIAQDNKIPGGDMVAFLESHNVPPSTLQTQIKATLTWSKVLLRTVRPRIDVGDDEIDAMIEKMRANAGKQEYLVSEIFLAVDKPEDEEQIKNLAEKLAEQLRGGGAFAPIARQFSQGAGAGAGGDIGWIQAGQLSTEADRLLQSLDVNQIGGPVRSSSGYHVLGVREKRTITLGDVKETKVKLAQAFRPFTADTNKEGLLGEAAQVRSTIKACEGASARLQGDFPGWRWQDLGEVALATAPRWLADKVAGLGVGESSEAMATDKGALILFLCDRSMPENINRDAIRSAIGAERMELMARRLMRDLRRDAFIDIRLKGML